MILHTDCRHFGGFRPCRFRRECADCPHHDVPATRVLIVNLDALGDVVRTTALLGPLHRAFPGAHVTWITHPRAVPLLDHVEGLDRVLPLADWTTALLQTLEFDLVAGVDKSLHGGALTMAARADERRAFGLDAHGAIVPLDERAHQLFRLGIDDEAKFVTNRKSEPQLLCEAMGWTWRRDPYRIALSPAERTRVDAWRSEHGLDGRVVIGFNTGSSEAFPYKHLTAAHAAELIERVARRCPDAALLLLGGPEDTARNQRIASLCATGRPLPTPTEDGLRRGLQAVAACDVVATGDSLGMHMAIGLAIPVVAWFGSTPHAEIELYGRGAWILADVDCRPCMRASCELEPKCFERVPLDAMADEVVGIVEATQRGEELAEERLLGAWPTWPPRRA